MGYPGPKRTAEELERCYLEAYRRWCAGESYTELAKSMAGPEWQCGSRTTAVTWVAKGRALEHPDDDPMSKRRAQRDAAGFALRDYQVRLARDVTAGRLQRDAAYRYELEAIRLYVNTLGLRRAPSPGKPNSAGNPGQVDPELLEDLRAAAFADGLLPPREEA